jgi:SNF family Na+-dependent transporter
MAREREQWASRIGLVLAMAGNAIGLGNFLRFPVQAAKNGGGAFMIPYFISFLLLGIPLMWIEWAIGRHGGKYGYSALPGMYEVLWKNKIAKYLGALGVFMPFGIVLYYNYIESWTLAYSFFSITKKYFGNTSVEAMRGFLQNYQGISPGSSLLLAFIFFIITLGLNIFVIGKGISGGIERLAKIAMPMLFVFAIVLVIRVLTLGAPDPVNHPERNLINGLAFIWNPNFQLLTSAGIWLAAAGQIFFTLSLGTGALHTYASYIKEKDDIALTGLATSSTNEFAEVVLGGTIAIPAAVCFFGIQATQQIAEGGAFDLGFNAMPVIFQLLPLGSIFGFLWFLLLFFAGITSSVALTQPAMAFLQDEFNISRRNAAIILGIILFITGGANMLFLKHGFLDEIDYLVGTFGLVVFALIEVIIFMWIYGSDKAWAEINKGAEIKIPRFFKFIMKYITPSVLLIILIAWTKQEFIGKLLMQNVAKENIPYIIGARLMLLILIATVVILVHIAWKRKNKNLAS